MDRRSWTLLEEKLHFGIAQCIPLLRAAPSAFVDLRSTLAEFVDSSVTMMNKALVSRK